MFTLRTYLVNVVNIALSTQCKIMTILHHLLILEIMSICQNLPSDNTVVEMKIVFYHLTVPLKRKLT